MIVSLVSVQNSALIPLLQQVFRPPLDIYDAVIHLRQKMVPRQNQAVDVTTETTIPVYQADMKCTKLPVYDFDPVQLYLSELRVSGGDPTGTVCRN